LGRREFIGFPCGRYRKFDPMLPRWIEFREGSMTTRIYFVSRMNRVYFMRGKMAAKVRDNPGGIHA